ncbi:hypothetical protein ACWD4F_23130 [Streptomyces aureus]
MGAAARMSGTDWIGEDRHAFCIRSALRFDELQKEELERGDTAAAERHKTIGILYLLETQNPFTGQPKRIVSNEEAARLRDAEDDAKQAAEDAERLAALKKKHGITPRANSSAAHPYSGGLPTLGKRR